jgi:hypothetical protein
MDKNTKTEVSADVIKKFLTELMRIQKEDKDKASSVRKKKIELLVNKIFKEVNSDIQ